VLALHLRDGGRGGSNINLLVSLHQERLEFSLVKLIDQLELLFLRICISERVYSECTHSTFQSQEYSELER